MKNFANDDETTTLSGLDDVFVLAVCFVQFMKSTDVLISSNFDARVCVCVVCVIFSTSCLFGSLWKAVPEKFCDWTKETQTKKNQNSTWRVGRPRSQLTRRLNYKRQTFLIPFNTFLYKMNELFRVLLMFVAIYLVGYGFHFFFRSKYSAKKG